MHEEMQKMKEQLESAERDKKKLSEKFMDKPVRPGGKLSVSVATTSLRREERKGEDERER